MTDGSGTELTRLVSSVLLIGCVVPFLIGALFFMSSNWWNTSFGKWLVGNPFVWDVAAYRELYLSVGIVWAVLATALNLHWFIERAKAFRSEIPTE